MIAPSATHRALAAATALALAACGKRDRPAGEMPAKDPALASASVTASATPSPSVTARAVPEPTLRVPVLAFTPLKEKPQVRHALYPIEGAVIVTDFARVGQLQADSDKINWFGKLPEGHNDSRFVTSLGGTWPDRVDVAWEFDGRSPSPSYLPLTGKGTGFDIPAGGKMTDPNGMTTEGIDFGGVTGIATVGASTLLAYHSYATGAVFRTVRGPAIARKSMTPKEAGCAEGEVTKVPHQRVQVALSPQAVVGTSQGTLLAFGSLCEKRGAALEVWDAQGKSRILTVPEGAQGKRDGTRLFASGPDEALVWSPGAAPALRYRGGALEVLPTLEKPTTMAFLSPDKKLHVSDGERIYREGDAGWVPVAALSTGWPGSFTELAYDGKAYWGIRSNQVGKLVPGAGEESVVYREGCAAPFVHLYDVAAKNEPKFTFPATRKALASFPDAEQITLVEVVAEGSRRLGVVVKNQGQAEALIAQLATTMPEEKPKLLCYGPTSPRVIPLKDK